MRGGLKRRLSQRRGRPLPPRNKGTKLVLEREGACPVGQRYQQNVPESPAAFRNVPEPPTAFRNLPLFSSALRSPSVPERNAAVLELPEYSGGAVVG